MTMPAVELLARETALREGDVPDRLAAPIAQSPLYMLERDGFLLKLPNGLAFQYRQGEGVTFSRPASVADAEVTLFLHGSVYGAVAWINGLVPLHASAVVHEGRVHAFTGVSGAGKSTLVAALGARGFGHFCDDVMVLDMRDPSVAMALPGHKQMKLWRDSLKLTGFEPGAQVRDSLDKFFVTPLGESADRPMPLASLYFLEERSRDAPNLLPLSGAERFSRGRAAFYRPSYCAALIDNQRLFAILAILGKTTKTAIFDRPKRKDLFAKGVDFIAAEIRSGRG